ncbi:MAG: LLM class flavin-dependent oxidoreductase [Armatimonadetes bacterium]|nr:LLM class flavin-dependent oxidoreductase [Armatimonadota bacterium]
MSESRVQVGLLLPTFSAQCSPARIVDAARRAEACGFHSLWTRDHLFIPEGLTHGGIRESGLHLEPLLALAAAGAATRRIKLGQAVLIPLRHPLALSQALGTLSFLAGDRLIVGLGAGFNREEFAAVGLPYDRRHQMVRETAEVLRKTWSGDAVSYRGEVFSFEQVRINPVPPPGTPIWYGGSSSAFSVRRAAAHFDGWMGGAPADAFDELLALLRAETRARGRRITVATIPPTSIARTTEEAMSRLDIPRMIQSMSHSLGRSYRSFEDIKTALIVGTPEEGCRQIEALGAKGVDVVILDLRVVGDRFDQVLGLIGDEMMPSLRAA